MPQAVRFLGWLLAGVVCVIVLAFIAGNVALRGSLPAAHAEINQTGVSAKVRVYRDTFGVPHVFAESVEDAALMLGYLHAGDRLFQMMMTKRAAQGRLAEVLGKDLVNYDRRMRLLNFTELAQENYQALSPDAQGLLQRYADGVNMYLARHKGLWPAEFLLLGFTPENWQPSDGLLWAKLMSWQLSGNLSDEIFVETLIKKGWTAERALQLYPRFGTDSPSTMAPLEWVERHVQKGALCISRKEQCVIPDNALRRVSGMTALSEPPQGERKNPAAFFERLPKQASNIFVISGSRTQSGKPLLANDPHLQLQTPVLWYLAHVTVPGFEFKGATAPGLPLFPLGQNGHVAWGFTTSNVDVQDVSVEKDSVSVITREEIIKVKDAVDVHFTARYVDSAPVISDVMPDVAALIGTHEIAVLHTTGLAPDDRTAEALMRINFAHDVKDVQKAVPLYQSPPQNLMAADEGGATAYFAVGAAPVRNGSDGSRFVRGAHKMVWRGFEKNPQLIDPKIGVMVNANNQQEIKTCGAACAPRMVAEPWRAMRLEKLLNATPKAGVEEASTMMLDITSEAALRLKPYMVAAATDKTLHDLLRAWDGRMDKESAAPLVYHAWLNQLLRRAYADAQGAETVWPRAWDAAFDLESGAIKQEDATQALSTAVAELEKKYGKDVMRLHWGDVHVAEFAHPVWSRVPLLKDLFSLRVATDGDASTLNRAAPLMYDGAEAFRDEHGAGYRAVYDLGDATRSRFVVAGGESGQPLSSFYGNLVPLWAKGRFITLNGTEKDFAARAPDVLFGP